MRQKINIIGATGKVGIETIDSIFKHDLPERGNHKNPSVITGLTARDHDQETFFYFEPEGISTKDLEDVVPCYPGDSSGPSQRVRHLVTTRGQKIKKLTEISSIINNAGLAGEAVIADVSTAEQASLDLHREILVVDSLRGNAVVTANKYSTSEGSMEDFRALTAVKGRFDYDTTVMGGAKALAFIRDSVNSTDPLTAFRAQFSGTLTFVPWFMESTGASWEEACAEAQSRGYAESDIRLDLSGHDAGRKAIGAIRTAGYDISFDDIRDNITPFRDYSNISPENMSEAIKSDNEHFASELAAARERGESLRYIVDVKFEGDKPIVNIGPKFIPNSDPQSTTSQTLNVFQAFTRVYDGKKNLPYMITAPGAGLDVTARSIKKGISAVLPHGLQQN